MERNQNPNIRQYPKSSNNPRPPRNEKPVFNKPIEEITTIYTDFLSNDYDKLINKINSGIILNFRNEDGKTLIHATIENSMPTMSEVNKLLIIKELVGKNVSVNAMDKFNRNPLHYSAQKGYIDII